jgi:hypothetical protein
MQTFTFSANMAHNIASHQGSQENSKMQHVGYH